MRASESPGWPIAETLGWLSVGLGVAGLLAPRQLARVTGLRQPGLLRLVGARELANGAGLLTQPNKEAWLWARVAGDVIDLAALALARGPSRRARSNAIGAAAVVGAIAVADLAAGLTYTRRSSLARETAADPNVYLDRTIIVNKTPRECYDYWRDLRNVARFTLRLEKVVPVDERRSRWILRIPGGALIEWESEIVEDRPGERLVWRSTQNAPFQHAGSINFHPAPGDRGTFVTVGMHYRAPGGLVGTTLARILGSDPMGEVRENLRRFKQLIETGEIPTTAGQPAGRRSFIARLLPEGRRSSPQAGGGRRQSPSQTAADREVAL